MFKFFLINLIIITILFYISFKVYNQYLERNNNERVDIIKFLNKGEFPGFKSIMIGMSFGAMFGFLDTLGLWVGNDQIAKYIKGHPIIKAGWASIYGSTFGSIVGTLFAEIIHDIFEYKYEGPIWLTTAGIFSGSIFGLYLGKLIYV